jgi:short-subunit dehydrogenase
MTSKSIPSILITGATSGIGRATALYLSGRGFHIIASGRREAELQALVSEAATAGNRIDTVRLDVTNADSIAAAVATVDQLTNGRGLDVLVNNAGFGIVGPLAETSETELRGQFETNVFGVMAVTRAFLPAMMKRRQGRIVNVTSLGGRLTFPFMGAYNSTKYALESLSDALRFELRPFGIDVAIIEPGVINTKFADTAMGNIVATNSAYASSLEKSDKLRARMEATAVGPIHVARAIERAVKARRPAARYVAPRRVAMVLFAKALLPTRVWDWAMRKFAYLPTGKVAVIAATQSVSSDQARIAA